MMRTIVASLFGALVGGALVLFGYLQTQPARLAPVVPPAVAAAPVSWSAAPATAQPAAVPVVDSELIADIYERVSPSVVSILSSLVTEGPIEGFPQRGAGSGFVIDKQGHILTNNHVVDGAGRLRVTLANGDSYRADVVGRDPWHDLAVVKIDAPAQDLVPVAVGDSDQVRVGELAVAIGNPFGYERTVTVGIISGRGRSLPSRTRRTLANLIQTDAPINPGNSGGVLLNARGEVIGINTAIENPTGQRFFIGLGFAVPINTAKRYLPQLLAGEKIKSAWLGISGTGITPDVVDELQLPTKRGVLVREVTEGGPAAKAGLRGGGDEPAKGDVITAIDSRPVTKVEDIITYLDAQKAPGDTVTLTILRGGQQQQLQVTLGEFPESTAPTRGR
ncbi:MAG: trypsin-like peptidase domain-containing protein [Chloroflexi bacterium]|nr:trypsin-like peptidase domain-containing protein [Chloroflexota bacterium]